MKKIATLLFFSVLSLATWAQITITKSNMPAAGDTFRYANVQAIGSNINVSNTGANLSWNFASLSKTDETLLEYKRSAQTSYGFYFINTFGTLIADNIGFGQFALSEVYNFYKNTTSNFTAEGIGFKFNNIPLGGFYTDKDEIYKFPLEYADRDSSSFKVTVAIPGLGSYKQGGTRINKVDGWGKLTTPYKTYNNCIRVKSEISQVDSFSVSQPFPISFGFPSTRTEYKWLSNEDNVPVLETSGNTVAGNFVPTVVRYRTQDKSTNPNTSVQAVGGVQVKVYPNPATDKIIVTLPNYGDSHVKLFSMEGKEQTISFSRTSEGLEIATQSLPAGYYMLFAKSGNEIIWEKIEISR